MTRKQTQAEAQRLQGIFADIRAEQLAANTAANRERVRWASVLLSAWIAKHNPPAKRGYGCREGKRQAAERRAHAG